MNKDIQHEINRLIKLGMPEDLAERAAEVTTSGGPGNSKVMWQIACDLRDRHGWTMKDESTRDIAGNIHPNQLQVGMSCGKGTFVIFASDVR